MTRKRRGPKPTGWGQMLGVRVHDGLMKPLDAYIAAQPDPKPSRPEAIRLILRDGLTGLGYMPHSEDFRVTN